jgi:hypothetical protein
VLAATVVTYHPEDASFGIHDHDGVLPSILADPAEVFHGIAGVVPV